MPAEPGAGLAHDGRFLSLGGCMQRCKRALLTEPLAWHADLTRKLSFWRRENLVLEGRSSHAMLELVIPRQREAKGCAPSLAFAANPLCWAPSLALKMPGPTLRL